MIKKSIITGNAPIDQLYLAIQRYVKTNGGNVLVIGGIEVIEFPGDEEKHLFRIAVKCTGKRPKFADKAIA